MPADKQTPKNARIGAGKAGPGRPRGLPNKTTVLLKDAILLAAEQQGFDGNGRDGLTGYLRFIAGSDVKAFSGLLGKVLPLHVKAETVDHRLDSMTDAELMAIALGGIAPELVQ